MLRSRISNSLKLTNNVKNFKFNKFEHIRIAKRQYYNDNKNKWNFKYNSSNKEFGMGSILAYMIFGGTSLPIFFSVVDQRTLGGDEIALSSVTGMFIGTPIVILGCFAFICSLPVRLFVKYDNDKWPNHHYNE